MLLIYSILLKSKLVNQKTVKLFFFEEKEIC